MNAIMEMLWFLLSIPVMLAGCVFGFFSAAFSDGVKQGKSDYVRLTKVEEGKP